jgi:ABC-2 type transport system permease protein
MSAATLTTPTRSASPDALIATARPPRPGRLAAALTFGWRGLLKIKHVPEQLMDVVMIPVIFTVLFTYLFGGALSGSTGDYLRFLLPGTLSMTVVLLTMYAGVSLNTDISRGFFDRVRTLPIWGPAPLVGALIGDVARYLLASAIVLGLGLALGFRPDAGGVGPGVALLLVFALSLSWVWTTLGLALRTPSAVMNAGFLVQFPLTMVSNVFVDPNTMPDWLQAFVKLNPVSHLASAERGLMTGQPPGHEIAWVLIASALLTAVFAPLTLALYRNRR